MKRAPFVHLAAVTLMACGGDDHRSVAALATDWDRSDPYAGIDFPLTELIDTALGFSRHDIYGALLDERGEAVVACMRERGFEPQQDEIPSRSVQEGAAGKIFGGSAEQAAGALAAIPNDNDAAATPTPDAQNAERSAAVVACYAVARDVTDPLEPLNRFIDSQADDMEQRVASDSRTVQATDEAGDCYRELGYGAQSESELASMFTDRANAIVLNFADGKVSRAEAEASLASLAEEEATVEPAVMACFYALDRVRTTVRGELEQEFIDTHGAALEQLLRETRDRLLDQLGDHLPSKS